MISVIVPVYNEEKNIERCVKSLLNQDFKDYEIIIINDGSKDNTLKILKQFKEIRIIDKKNEGRIPAINDGLKVAKGKIIAITDGDCIIPRDWLKNINEEIKGYDAVGGVYESTENDGISLAGNMLERIFMDYEIIPNKLPGANSAYKKEILKEYPYRKWGADSFLYMKLKKEGRKIKITDRIKIKTHYPDTLKKAIKRKLFWGAGLANTIDKITLGFLIRPVYFSVFTLSLVNIIVSLFFQSMLGINLLISFLLYLLPSLGMFGLSLYWIKDRKYYKALPHMLYLPFIQEYSYFIGFIRGLFGRKVENAWR